MKNTEWDWFGFFDSVFKEARVKFKECYPFKDESEVSSGIIALRDAIWSLPIPIKLFDLEIDIERPESVKDKLCQIVRYDFSNFGVRSIEFYGIVALSNTQKIKERLIKKFGLKDDKYVEEICRDLEEFRFVSAFNTELDFWIEFIPYNIRNKFNNYVEHFVSLFLEPWHCRNLIVQKFKKPAIDYNALYNLKDDPILPLSEITKKDAIFSGFARLEDGKTRPITIEDLQKNIRHIQLIPDVPVSVRRVFDGAKNLFIFGYFRYYFFTISMHYAFLALESAIKNKYNKSLGRVITLTNKRGWSQELKSPSHQRIIDFCKRTRGWNFRKIEVNEDAFPYSNRLLTDWLVRKEIIPQRERELYNVGIFLRNALSHLTNPMIVSPGEVNATLEKTAYRINKLYAKLKKGKLE